MPSKPPPAWKTYEELIHHIYTNLHPKADVRIDDMIPGRNSGINRQIDVSIRTKIAHIDVLIVIQAKAHKKPIDINVVGEFSAVIQDVGAQKGIIFCTSGFTKSAITAAKNLRIDLMTIHDYIGPDWLNKYQFPVIRKSVNMFYTFKIEIEEMINYKLQKNTQMSNELIREFLNQPLHTKKYGITTFFKQFLHHWDKNEELREKGTHEITLEGGVLSFHHQRFKIEDFKFEFRTEISYYFKYMQIFEFNTLRDHTSGAIHKVTTWSRETFPFLNDGTWEQLEDPKAIAIKPITLDMEVFDFGINIFKRLNFRMKDR